jgi:hypothetical protein
MQQIRSGNQTPQSNKGQQSQGRGRVNHVSAETAQENPQVVLDMFFVNSIPASILFDSGGSHSFISSQFVAKHSIPMCPMKQTMLVAMQVGRQAAAHPTPTPPASLYSGNCGSPHVTASFLRVPRQTV